MAWNKLPFERDDIISSRVNHTVGDDTCLIFCYLSLYWGP